MKYNENFYVVIHNSNTALKVKGATYSKDKRLFIHKNDNGYSLTDKNTGLYVVFAKTLKKLDEKYKEKVALYNKVVKGKIYGEFKSKYREILCEGEILYEVRG